jgi:DNA helicase HerA-like ATPase
LGKRLRKIGIVASRSTVMEAAVILAEGEERYVKAEDLVLISNRNGNEIMAVCRGGIGSNENLRTGSYSPGVAYARIGRHPSNAKEFYAFGLSVVGDVSNNTLRENKMLIAPSSEVEIFEETDNPMNILGSTSNTVGYYKDHPSWRIPVDSQFICYHMGVFAATGAGKSLLTRYEIIPFLKLAGYKVLIFDWKGSDYTPFFSNSFEIADLGLDDDVVIEYLCSSMDYFGYYASAMIERNPIRAALETVVYESDWRKFNEPEKLRGHLQAGVKWEIERENTDKTGRVSYWGRNYIRRFEKSLAKMSDEELKNVMGKMGPAEIVEAIRQHDIVVVDLSTGSKQQKLSIFLSIAKHLCRLMERKERLNLAVIIDEGPQYCPFKPKGIETRTMEMISDLCALGRSYNLSVVLLSQGIAGEIGINASIRRNLNTQFIGKINPLDFDEAMKLLGQADIDPKYLILMPVGDFYVTGKMNPSPIPLLIHFDIAESDIHRGPGEKK